MFLISMERSATLRAVMEVSMVEEGRWGQGEGQLTDGALDAVGAEELDGLLCLLFFGHCDGCCDG
jgi:hypothetical protein